MDNENLSQWQLVFSQSVVNGADNGQDLRPIQPWAWPRKTWFDDRLSQVRKQRRFGERKESSCQE